jgi:excisionase family DNA binding protein
MTVIEAAERFGVKDVTIRARLRAGKSAAQAVGIAP